MLLLCLVGSQKLKSVYSLFLFTWDPTFDQVMILLTLVTLSPPSYNPHRFEFPTPFNPMLPLIDNQNISEPVCLAFEILKKNIHEKRVNV